ncbi:sugar ABC transporter substrate-binding protein [Breznakiella homolactica]|uniref:ABC transporter substrate-binding protein n=1 Tax=Breznakiella homolactica TaxID=2798577 RepID=A0A7T7XQV7_9SPIR|nr:ABC transporter substrate-binding protein [Breznakiella homolactica]QQO10827.1 ABC transporter substrate-binding protein [Breznakiella homolactica]
MQGKKLSGSILLLFAALSFFIGCSKSNEAGAAASGKETGEITLMIINSFTKTPEDPIYKAAEDYYNRTGVKVTIEAVPSTNIKDKFTTAALAGSGPDIVTLDNAGWTADLAAIGLLAPIDNKLSEIRSELLPDALATNVYKGVTYGVPWYVNNMVMYYNKAMFAKAGITAPPANWQQLEDAVRKLKAIGKYGLNFPIGSPGGYTVCAFLMQNGNEIIDTSGSEPKVVFNSRSGVEALTFITDLYTKYKGMPESVKSTLSWDQVFAPFIQEDAGIVFSGDWAIAAIKAGNPNLDYGIAPLPVGREAASILGGYNLAINKNSKKPDLAWDFIKWLSESEQSKLLAEYNRISARRDTVESDFVKENPIYSVFVQETVNSKSRPVVTQWQQIQTYLGDAFASVILGEYSPQQALDKYAKLSEELIANQ